MNNLPAEKNRRVLIIDDNRAIHDDFRKILCHATATVRALDASEAALFGSAPDPVEPTQFEVDSAYQGEEGVLMAAKAIEAGRPYALAFVDVRMPPGWDGVETTTRLWQQDPNLQVVLCTAYADYSWGEMFEALGQSDGMLILKKPFDSVEAFQLAHALTEKWWLHQQSRRKMEELEGHVAARTQELAYSLSLLNATLDSTTDGIVAVDLSGKVVSYNARFVRTWQFPADVLARRDAAEMRTHTAGQVKHPAKFLQRLEELQAHPDAETFDVIELKDGRIFERYVFPQRIDRKCVGTVINWRDITERKRAEEELQWKTAFLEAQVNSSMDGIMVVDQEGKQALQNQRFIELLKMPPDIAAEKSDERRLRWVTDQIKNPKQFVEKVRYLYAHRDKISRDEIELKDGTVLERYSSPVVGKDEKYYGRIWTFRDITERKRAEEALRESEDRYRLLVEESPDGIGIYQDGKLVFVNSTGTRQMGAKTQDELLGRTSEQNIHPDDLTAANDRIRRRLAGETGMYPAEVRYLRLDGTTIPMEISAAPIIFNGKSAMQFIARDITERKHAEEALRESKDRFSGAFEHAPIGMALVLPDGHWLQVNPVLCELVGYSEAELLPGTFQDITHPDDLATDLENVRQLIAGEIRSYQMEKRYVHQRGHVVTVLLSVSLVRDGQGQPRYFISHVQDITERKQAENALRESNEKFHQLADNITDAFWIRSPDLSEVHYLSPAFERIWGRTRESLYAHPHAWADFILPEDRERVQAAFAALTGDAPSLDLEYRIVRPNGEIRWVRVRGFQVRDAAAKLIRHTGIVTDITEHKRNEITALAISKLGQRLSSATTAREAFVIIQEVSHELFAWHAFRIRLYSAQTDTFYSGFTVDTIKGQPVAEEQNESVKPGPVYRRVIAQGGELILREHPPAFGPDMTPFGDVSRPSAALMFVPILSRGQVVGMLSVQSYTPNAYDQKDLKTLQTMADQCGGAIERIWAEDALRKAETQLYQSQKLETVGKLAGGVAHEFNSILTAIIGQSELILGDLPPGHALAQNATEISQAAERAAKLTRQLLAYGRRTFLQPEPLDLNQIIANMADTIRHHLGSAVDVRIVPAAGLHTVKADAGQIEQVIMNLVMNAADAMPNGGKLTLETANITFDPESVVPYPDLKPGNYVRLAITDTGAGMSEAVKARAFEPFFTTKDIGQGSGLGLSTCYGIIKQSGGHLSLYSEPGRGTTFKIYLPQIAPQVRQPILRLDSIDMPRGTETVLLVEDDPALREMAATLLRRLGYTVYPAANGVEALSVQHGRSTGHIDLLFTDVVMPHMSGTELADRVRALYPHTRILFTSAYTANAILHQGVFHPGVALLQKPFTPSALAQKIREVLDQPAAPEPTPAPKPPKN